MGGILLQLNTKYFGSIHYQDNDVLHFSNGLFGFEQETAFLLLPFEGSDGNLLCFQSTQTPSLAFIAMNPFSLDPSYSPILSKEELCLMDVERSEDLCYYVLCVVRDPIGESTVNFKCPVIVNPDTCKATQVILDTNVYHMRHRLAEFQNGEEVAC